MRYLWKQATLPVMLMVAIAMMIACASINPFAAAETLEQRAYAAESAYNIVLQSALDLVTDPNVPASVKSKILEAEATATPVIEGLSQAVSDLLAAKAALAAGTTTEGKVLLIAQFLETWIRQAESAIAAMARIINDEGGG